MGEAGQPRVNKAAARAMDRYAARLAKGERILRDANGRLKWPNGRSAGEGTVANMLECGRIAQLDADLFGDPSRGQTLGLERAQ